MALNDEHQQQQGELLTRMAIYALLLTAGIQNLAGKWLQQWDAGLFLDGKTKMEWREMIPSKGTGIGIGIAIDGTSAPFQGHKKASPPIGGIWLRNAVNGEEEIGEKVGGKCGEMATKEYCENEEVQQKEKEEEIIRFVPGPKLSAAPFPNN
jgi:hypothetical protein